MGDRERPRRMLSMRCTQALTGPLLPAPSGPAGSSRRPASARPHPKICDRLILMFAPFLKLRSVWTSSTAASLAAATPSGTQSDRGLMPHWDESVCAGELAMVLLE